MADRRMWKMSPERLQEHLKLRSRASRIPDKKKEQSKKACCARIVSGFERIYTRMSRHSVNEVPAMGVNDPTCAGLNPRAFVPFTVSKRARVLVSLI